MTTVKFQGKEYEVPKEKFQTFTNLISVWETTRDFEVLRNVVYKLREFDKYLVE